MKTKSFRDLVEIYGRLEQIFARKGPRSIFPGQRFQHPFKLTGTKVYGVQESGLYPLRPGDLVIRSTQGKRLWKPFRYPVDEHGRYKE